MMRKSIQFSRPESCRLVQGSASENREKITSELPAEKTFVVVSVVGWQSLSCRSIKTVLQGDWARGGFAVTARQ